MKLNNIINNVKKFNKSLNFFTNLIFHTIAKPTVGFIGGRMDYEFLRPVKYFLGAIVIGPIAGILLTMTISGV